MEQFRCSEESIFWIHVIHINAPNDINPTKLAEGKLEFRLE